jgi:hypothetical protein
MSKDAGEFLFWLDSSSPQSSLAPSFQMRCRSCVRPAVNALHHHIPRVAEGDQGDCVYGRGGLEVGGLAGTPPSDGGRAAHIGMRGARHLAVRDRRCRHRGARLAPSDRRFWRSAAVKDSVSRVDAFALFTPQVRVECWRKKRTISRLASGPRGSVNDPAGLPPDHAWPAP